MNLVSNQDRLIRYCSIACLASTVGLLAIWVLPNTIALRHIFLGIGFIAAIPLILQTQFLSRKSISELLPLLLLLALFIWVIVHLTFFSLDFDLELKEFKTLWARSFLGAVLAIGFSIAIQRDSKLQPPFFVALFIVSILNIEAYLYMCAKAGAFISFREYVWTFVFKKIEAAYFGVLAISIACGNIVYLLGAPPSKIRTSVIAWWILGIVIALIASIINITKNGIAIGVGLCALLAFTYLMRTLFYESRSGLKVILSLGLIGVIILGGWQVNRLFSSPGWSNFVDDVKISSRIDEHSYWKKNNSTVFPMNNSGVMVSGNVYERMSWATAGVRLIKAYPMGYGSINRSFVGMLNHAKIEQELESSTHSGWIDFGLAFGVPGLVIMLTIFLSILWFGFWKGGQFGLMGAWLAIGLIPFGVVAEINYKHNFEILIFFITFAAASVIGIQGSKSNSLKVNKV
jgi:hypothetical protein